MKISIKNPFFNLYFNKKKRLSAADRSNLLKSLRKSDLHIRELRKDLSQTLSKYFKINFDEKQWYVVLEPWLTNFVHSLTERKRNLTKINLNLYKKIIFEIIETCPKTSHDLILNLQQHNFNNLIYYELLKKKIDLGINKSKVKNKLDFNLKNQFIFIVNLCVYLACFLFLHLKNSHLYINFFMNKFSKSFFKFFYIQNQVPVLIRSQSIKQFKPNYKLRYRVFEQIIKKHPLNYIIIKFMPSSIFEGFKFFYKKRNFFWPEKPKKIFTSNSHLFDDHFKIYLAKNYYVAEKGIFQHGGSIGIAKEQIYEEYENKISDKNYIWGNYKRSNKIVTGKTNYLLKRKNNYNQNNGKVLLILNSQPKYFYTKNSFHYGHEYVNYLNDQKEFIDKLNQKNTSNLLIRLPIHDYSWNIRELFLNHKSISIDKQTYLNSIISAKVRVCTHNATTLLDCLNLNLPTIIFWDKNFNEIRNEAKEIFKILKKNNIFFNSPKDAAKFLNKNYKDISSWWYESKLQNSIKIFKKKYCQDLNLNKII